MNDARSLLDVLRHTVSADIADEIGKLIATAPDRKLNRINVLAFAAERGLDEETAIAGFLHASRLGLFEFSWNILCPGCGGVLDAGASLKHVHSEAYTCALCAAGYEPSLDELVEVTFTVSPKLRRIEAHHPDQLSAAEYFRQIYWSSGVDLPEDDYEAMLDEFIVEALELPAGEKAVISIQIAESFLIVFEPVTHAAQFIEVKGEPTKERQALSLVFDRSHRHHETLLMRPGALRIAVESHVDVRTLPSVCVANDALHQMLGRRRPFLTAKRVLSNQTFRDIHRADTLDVDQRFKIASLTFLFTDLRGSTELYERVGDLVAFDLVRAHFKVLSEIVASETGAVVKTIGDAVMASFPAPERALAAAVRMRDAMRGLNRERGKEDMILKIGLHEGPCIAVNLDERQDYFGQTVNIASRVQHLAASNEIFTTDAVLGDPHASALLAELGLQPLRRDVGLRGVSREIGVFVIP